MPRKKSRLKPVVGRRAGSAGAERGGGRRGPARPTGPSDGGGADGGRYYGSEFTSNHFDAWSYLRGIQIDFIRPGKPVENAYIESFNGRLRDECLNTEWFSSLEDARRSIKLWQQEYNTERPHSAPGDLSPAEFVAQMQYLELTNVRPE